MFSREDPLRMGKYTESEASRQEVDFAIEKLGIESVWGDFDSSPFDRKSKRMIVIAARPL